MSLVFSKKLALYTGLPALIVLNYGARSLLADQKYLELSNGELLYNSFLYEKRNNLSKIYQPTKGFNERITKNTDHYLYRYQDETKSLALVNSIANYSVKLMSNCGHAGTGWFLDWEIPETGKYPTKWFIATNAHVISNFVFSEDAYPQIMRYLYRSGLCYSPGGQPTTLYLIKDIKPDTFRYEIKEFIVPRTIDHAIKTKVLETKDSNGENQFVYSKVTRPKRFYTPINFAGDKYSQGDIFSGFIKQKINYLKDFAVLEVNFASENEAMVITDNLYTKIQNKSTSEIDFFADDLLTRQSGDDLLDNQEHYYVGGYPGSLTPGRIRLSFAAVYSTMTRRTGKLAYLSHKPERLVRNIHDQIIVGYLDTTDKSRDTFVRHSLNNYQDWGYSYLLNNMSWAHAGTSGSLVIDSQGRMLGMLTSGFTGTDIIGVTPIRSAGMMKDSRIIYPKYDLIRGTEGQIGSYKESLDKAYPNIKTQLRNKWTVK